MAELSNEKSPSTVPSPSTGTEPTVSESIPSREDASREDGKRKPNIGNLPENGKRMKIVQYVTQRSFEFFLKPDSLLSEGKQTEINYPQISVISCKVVIRTWNSPSITCQY